MTIYTFTKNGDQPPVLPDRPGLQFKHIRFDSTKLDDLMLVAKYRIIDFPMSVIVDGRGQVLMKVRGTIPESYIDNLLASN